MQLHWTRHPGTGPPLLLVHGFLMGPSQWLKNLDALGEVCQPIVVDLWGHGHSPAPEQAEPYRPVAYVDAFESIRKALEADAWFLCGYSLGAGLTIRYALTHPERVVGHAFTNSTSGFAGAKQVEVWEKTAAEGAARILEGGRPAIERIPVHPRFAKRLDSDIYDAMLIDAELLAPLGIANTVRYTTPRVSVREDVNSNERPALLLNGQREKRFQPMREFIANAMANVAIVDLDAGHGVNMEAYADFNRALTEFITQCRTS